MLCLAQLNRGVEHRDNKRPRMSDLRQSGEIEEDADNVLMMYRDDYYDRDTIGERQFSQTELGVEKFRDDIMDQRIILAFDLRHQFFGDRSELGMNTQEVRLNDYLVD